MTTVFRPDGAILLQNPAAAAHFAIAMEEAGGNAFLRHFLDPSEAATILKAALAGQTVHAQLPVHTAAGTKRLQLEVSPMTGAPGDEQLVLLVEQPAGPAMGNDEQRLRDYAEAAADWFWEMDAALRFSYMSESTQMPAANSTEGFIGRRLTEVPGAGVEDGDWNALTDLLDARLPFRDFRFRCRDSRNVLHHLSLSGLPVFDDAGGFSGYRGIGRDLTLLLRAEDHAANAHNRLIDAIEIDPGMLHAARCRGPARPVQQPLSGDQFGSCHLAGRRHAACRDLQGKHGIGRGPPGERRARQAFRAGSARSRRMPAW